VNLGGRGCGSFLHNLLPTKHLRVYFGLRGVVYNGRGAMEPYKNFIKKKQKFLLAKVFAARQNDIVRCLRIFNGVDEC
jgi:hypothetical protein